MESQKTPRLALIALAVLAVGGCAVPRKVEQTPPARPVVLSVEQAGAGDSTRFVFCAQEQCPALTPKTPANGGSAVASAPARPAPPTPAPAAAPVEVDVQFAFNDWHINLVDRDRISLALQKSQPQAVLITARSDFVGPPVQQQRVAQARAAELRKLIAAIASPGTRIAEALEIAAPDRVPSEQQARQRRGTVRFLVQQPSAGA